MNRNIRTGPGAVNDGRATETDDVTGILSERIGVSSEVSISPTFHAEF